MISKKINDKFKIKMQNLSSVKTLAAAKFIITCLKKKKKIKLYILKYTLFNI